VPSKCALITGASAGIGAAIATRLLAEGWRVLGVDVAAAGITHGAYTHARRDLSDTKQVATLLSQTPDIDAFVHAAGILRVGELGGLDLGAGEAMWRLHVAAATQIANALAPRMVANAFGRLVFISSRVASGKAGRGQYAATKAGLIALARSWAAELAPKGVTVNTISPAATDTAMLSDPARSAAAPSTPPIGRLIQPVEIAALTSYLLSDNASGITGQDLVICGGASLG
jgi:3-oxoacyl-[acyl-carrier protein] reductase